MSGRHITHKGYSLQEKKNYLKDHEIRVLSHPAFAKSKGIPLSTWRDIFRVKDEIMKEVEGGVRSTSRIRKREGQYAQLEDALYKWVVSHNSQGAHLSTALISSKAQDLAKVSKIENFKGGESFVTV